MSIDIVTVLYFFMWYLLIGIAALYFLLGLDEVFFDCYYWCSYARASWHNRKAAPLNYENLFSADEQFIAVMIPCWQEAGVISKMLAYNLQAIDYEHYNIFVGVYPNDSETLNEVKECEKKFANVHCVVNHENGPTNKASNLNAIYAHIKTLEQSMRHTFELFVMHDAEDVIHPMSFKLYNHLIPEKDMIQIPVYPLIAPLWRFTHWLYAEEFSENHTKNIVVRQSISGHVPSAGVGTAFAKQALQQIENPQTKAPFSTDSLTEDYRVSLAMRLKNFQQAFVNQSLIRTRWKKRSFWRKGYYLKPVKERIATRAYFPMSYKSSIRQKSRWIIGIVFQEWQKTKWPRGWRLRYMLARDRKPSISHIITGMGYAVFLFWLAYSIAVRTRPQYPDFHELLYFHKVCWWLLVANILIMIERITQRMIATYRIYGILPALFSFPRAIYGNVLNLHALLRAYNIYYRNFAASSAAKKSRIKWDKTAHAFPLAESGPKLGNLLLQKQLISKVQLNKALKHQQATGERLGDILCHQGALKRETLIHLLASQYNMALLAKNEVRVDKCQPNLLKKHNRWLQKHGIYIVDFYLEKKTITLAIDDPTNSLLLKKVENRLLPFNVSFVLLV